MRQQSSEVKVPCDVQRRLVFLHEIREDLGADGRARQRCKRVVSRVRLPHMHL